MDKIFRDRRFGLAVASLAAGAVGLAWGKVSGSEFVGLVTVVLGLYGGVDVFGKGKGAGV